MPLESLSIAYLDLIEHELHQAVDKAYSIGLDELHYMLSYHMGWEGEGAGREAQGKRIRPLLVLLTCASAGGEWKKGLPAACAAELVHNFSLIHDDIEDKSPLRRGRPTIWKKWGVPQAVNAGDAMFTLAYLEILRLEETISTTVAVHAVRLLHNTCLHLTQGQYLDLSYEDRGEIRLEDYWPMIGGKTAALIAACTELGSLAAGVDNEKQLSYREFGRLLGLAFQVQDDYLGIWGDTELTGKSADSDLLTGKKSLPVLYGLNQHSTFAQRWKQGPIKADEVPKVANILEQEGGRDYTRQTADRLTQEALHALDFTNPIGEPGQALKELAYLLLRRQL
jgi:geranylgeranyl diphosphate synthase, type I